MKILLKKAIIIAILLSCFTCKKNEQFLLEMPYKEKFSVNAGLNSIKTWYFNIKDIRSNRAELLTTFGVEESEITKINPGKAKLINVFGGNDYKNIEKISVQIFNDDVQKSKEIFYRDDVSPSTGSDLDLIATLVDLNDYIGENFNIVVKIKFRSPPPVSFENRLEFSFIVL